MDASGAWCASDVGDRVSAVCWLVMPAPYAWEVCVDMQCWFVCACVLLAVEPDCCHVVDGADCVVLASQETGFPYGSGGEGHAHPSGVLPVLLMCHLWHFQWA